MVEAYLFIETQPLVLQSSLPDPCLHILKQTPATNVHLPLEAKHSYVIKEHHSFKAPSLETQMLKQWLWGKDTPLKHEPLNPNAKVLVCLKCSLLNQ